MMTSTHYEGCWRVHLQCALVRIRELEATCKALAGALDALIIDDDWGLSVRSDLKLAARARDALAQYKAGKK